MLTGFAQVDKKLDLMRQDMDKRLELMKQDTDKRFDHIDKQFEILLGISGLVIGIVKIM